MTQAAILWVVGVIMAIRHCSKSGVLLHRLPALRMPPPRPFQAVGALDPDRVLLGIQLFRGERPTTLRADLRFVTDQAVAAAGAQRTVLDEHIISLVLQHAPGGSAHHPENKRHGNAPGFQQHRLGRTALSPHYHYEYLHDGCQTNTERNASESCSNSAPDLKSKPMEK